MDYKKFFKNNKVTLSDRDFVAIKVGGLITAARLHSQKSQTELAKAIGTQQPSLARAESGEVIPSIEYLYKIAQALKTNFVFPSFGFMKESEKVTQVYFDANRHIDSQFSSRASETQGVTTYDSQSYGSPYYQNTKVL